MNSSNYKIIFEYTRFPVAELSRKGRIKKVIDRVRTVCKVINEDTNKIEAIGIALTSTKDNFTKNRGRIISEGRAAQVLWLQSNIEPVRDNLINLMGGTHKGIYLS